MCFKLGEVSSASASLNKNDPLCRTRTQHTRARQTQQHANAPPPVFLPDCQGMTTSAWRRLGATCASKLGLTKRVYCSITPFLRFLVLLVVFLVVVVVGGGVLLVLCVVGVVACAGRVCGRGCVGWVEGAFVLLLRTFFCREGGAGARALARRRESAGRHPHPQRPTLPSSKSILNANDLHRPEDERVGLC